ncbi:MAG: hypothetical protein AABY03_00440 [Nanoarchaeota archaeon]
MAEDKSLTEIQDLEVGDLERTIHQIEETKHRIENLPDDSSSQLAEYSVILEEKLPKLLSNISAIGPYICGLPDDSLSLDPQERLRELLKNFGYKNYWRGVVMEEGVWSSAIEEKFRSFVEVSKRSGLNYLLSGHKKDITRLSVGWPDYIIHFDFDYKANLKGIELEDTLQEIRFAKNLFLRSRNVGDFARKCVKVIEEGKYVPKGFVPFPTILNLIPKMVVSSYNSIYEEKLKEKNSASSSLFKQIEELDTLQVSDFK